MRHPAESFARFLYFHPRWGCLVMALLIVAAIALNYWVFFKVLP